VRVSASRIQKMNSLLLKTPPLQTIHSQLGNVLIPTIYKCRPFSSHCQF